MSDSPSHAPTAESAAASSAAMLAMLDSRHSLDGTGVFEPHTPSSTVLHEFIANWDDELLHGTNGGDDAMTIAADDGSPMGTPAGKSTSTSKSHKKATDASPTSSSSGSDRGAATGVDRGTGGDDGAPTTAAPARKRVRRKVEVAQLRGESAFLENKLYELREYWKNAPAALLQQQQRLSGADAESEHELVSAEPLWKQIAYRQHELLTESERKNDGLRAEYTLQRKIARDLRKLLMKRATAPTEFDSALYLLKPRNPQLVFNASHQTFERLLDDTQPMIAQLPRIEHIMASRSHVRQTFRDWQVQEGQLKSVFLDLVDSYVLPFDRLQVNKAIRRLYGEGNTANTEKHFCEYFHCSEDKMLRQIIHAYKHDRRSGHVRHREAARNFSDDTQSIFLVVTLIQPVSASGEPIHGITLREQKWIIVRTGDSGHDESHSSRVSGAVSSVQAYHKITCESVDSEYAAHWTRSMLLEGMMPMWDASLEVIRRRLESFLIEQGVSNSRRLEAAVVR